MTAFRPFVLCGALILRNVFHANAFLNSSPSYYSSIIRRKGWFSSASGAPAIHTGRTTAAISSSISPDAATASTSGTPTQVDNVYNDDDEDEQLVANADSLPMGIKEGFAVIHHFEFQGIGKQMDKDSATKNTNETLDSTTTTNECEDEWEILRRLVPEKDIQRLELTPNNVTLPVALMVMDPIKFQSISRARKFCRHGRILLHRGPLGVNETSGTQNIFIPEQSVMGKVGERVYPGDIIGRQVAVGSGYFSARKHNRAPPFDLPVVYEDDHFAIVNKPAGIVVYSPKYAEQGLLTVKMALLHALKPPRAGVLSALKRPKSVHRLDKPTSGLLVVGKTLPAMEHLSRQFANRIVKKTYTAVLNGIPKEDPECSISSKAAFELGVDVDPESDAVWQWIDSPLDEKHAVTIWRALRYANSTNARDGILTLVEVKPKTGRYHQIRRHMAWNCERALVGDKGYDGGHVDAIKLRGRGLFLCSNRVTLQHPFYNTMAGREVWNTLEEHEKHFDSGKLWLCKESDTVMLSASIELPQKFQSFLDRSEKVFEKYARKGDQIESQ